MPHVGLVADGYRTGQGSPASRVAGVKELTAGIALLIVVEHVGEHHLELSREAFGNFEHLVHAEVDVPVGQAAIHADAPTVGITNPRRAAVRCKTTGKDWRRSSHPIQRVVGRTCPQVCWSDGDSVIRVSESEEVQPIALAGPWPP